MKSLTKFLFVFAGLFIGLASCSKEKRIENQLIRKDGKWKITSINYNYYADNTLESALVFNNAGTIEFSKKGTFIMTMTLSGSPETSAGTWTNTKENITLVSDGETSVMKISDGPKKNKLVLEQTEYYTSTNEKEVYVFNLERVD